MYSLYCAQILSPFSREQTERRRGGKGAVHQLVLSKKRDKPYSLDSSSSSSSLVNLWIYGAIMLQRGPGDRDEICRACRCCIFIAFINFTRLRHRCCCMFTAFHNQKRSASALNHRVGMAIFGGFARTNLGGPSFLPLF